jgi:fucose permease
MAYGLVVPATNLCVAEQSGERQSAALSLLNLAWSVGSLVCPVIVRYGVRTANLNFLILVIAAAAALLGLLGVISHARQFPHHAPAKPAVANALPIRNQETWWAAVFLALIFFIYVGTENAVSGWSAAFSKRLTDSGIASGELAPIYFWAGLLAGRLLAPLILKHVQETKVASIGLLTAAFGIVIFLRSYTRPLAMAGFVIAGAGLSMLYPIFIAWLTWAFGARARRIAGIMFATGSIGGATLPWLVGAISSHSGSLRTGLLVPFAGCLLMFLFAVVFRRTALRGLNAASRQ